MMVTAGITKNGGSYQKYIPKQKATIGNYAPINGRIAALCHYAREFPNLNYTTVCEWRKVIYSQIKKPARACD